MRARYIVLSVISVLLALGCFRLSKWQIDRRTQRRARNAMLATRLQAPPTAVDSIPADTAHGHYRRIAASGRFDYERELALALRSREGSPGIYILTPLQLADGRTLLVNRGWIYAPDGMSADLTQWREDDTVTVEGFLDTYVEPRGAVTLPGRPQLARRLVRDSLLPRLGAATRLFPYVLVATTASPAPSRVPARIAPPSLSEGPHLSYAIQWAAFGVIALFGTVLALRRGFADRRTDVVAASAA